MNTDVAVAASRSNRWPTVAILILAVAATIAATWFFALYTLQSIRISFAAEQIQVFDWSLESALQAEPSNAVEHLQYVRDYYTSGTKQTTGSFLDRMVEAHRAGVIREIIAHLRTKTGTDVGNDPQPWIDRYGAR